MITRIREVRRASGMTLGDVARRCRPTTTPQTIGRLETGARTVSVGWLNRIAEALGVNAEELVAVGKPAELEVAAIVGQNGAAAPRTSRIALPPRTDANQVAVLVKVSVGDYRAGDELWCTKLNPADFAQALNHDVLIPRPAGRFLFGRLINRDEEKLQVLPLEPGGRQQVVSNPQWLGVVRKLIRSL
jgi:transcriptional regulator with XRE-family HTH domain